MSTSLKVVSWAAVFWDSFRRRAMVLRKRVIGTRSSRASLWRGRAGAAAAGAGAEAGGLGASAAVAGEEGAAALGAGAEPLLPSAMAPSSAPTETVLPAWAVMD